MSKKRKKTKNAQNRNSNESAPALSRRKFIMLPIAVAAIGTAAFGISKIEANNTKVRDLSIIGKGQPVVVQVFDQDCPVCKRLHKVLKKSIKGQDAATYRLADIASAEGKAFQTKYKVPHITLLYFDAKGKHLQTSNGMRTVDEINSEMSRLF